jgi:LysM repeat protein
MRKKLIFFLLVFFLFFPAVGKAVNTETVGILPAYPDPEVKFSNAWFIYKLGAGQTKEDAVRVINNKKETVVVKLYAVDATTTSDGAFALLPEESPRQDVGAWVKLAANEVEIPPNSEKLVPFTISVPENADVGDHAGGIVMQEIEGAGKTIAGTGVKIVTRVGVRIYLTIPGEVKKDFEITRFDWRTEAKREPNFLKDLLDLNKKTVFTIGLKNKGNVKISPKGKVELYNIFGRKVGDTGESEIGVIFPKGENKESVITLNQAPFLGRYKAKLSVNFLEEGAGTGEKELVIWVFPYRIVIILAFLLVLFILTRLIFQYFREASKEKMPVYTVKEGETLGNLASVFSVHWKKLAKVNEIKKPFEIKAGQKLFVPPNHRNIDFLVNLVKQGRLGPPLKEKSAKARRKKKMILIFVAGLIVFAGAFFWYKHKKKPAVSQIVSNPTAQSEPTIPQEDEKKTISGAIKKSSIQVGIFSPPSNELTSSLRLFRKLRLIGYRVEIIPDLAGRQYSETTIEYAPGNEEQAKIVKNDLGINFDPGLKEVSGLGKDVIIYNLINKDDLPKLEAESGKTFVRRDLVRVKVLEGGGGKEMAEKVRTLIYQAGFTPDEEIGEAQRKDNVGIGVIYSNEDQREGAEDLVDFLNKNQYPAKLEKNSESKSAEELILIVGK